jgi:hypothetical protein
MKQRHLQLASPKTRMQQMMLLAAMIAAAQTVLPTGWQTTRLIPGMLVLLQLTAVHRQLRLNKRERPAAQAASLATLMVVRQSSSHRLLPGPTALVVMV